MKPLIILPQKISILRDKKKQDIIINREEFSIYYKNIIYPYSEDYDIKIKCDYGKNLGFCWRIDNFENISNEFLLTVCIYRYAELLCEKTVTVHIEERNKNELSLLCIGDSMTQTALYVRQAAEKAEYVKTLGSRKTSMVFHEGRGGWALSSYLENYKNHGGCVSPFMFPKGIDAEKYYGDLSVWEGLLTNPNAYSAQGFEYKAIEEGMYALKGEYLVKYIDGEFETVDIEPVFEFDFEKYLKRNNIEAPDVVTLLFGANDLQMTEYENTESEIQKMLIRIKQIIDSVKKCGARIVINLPVCGADQYCWGTQNGCMGTVKQYDYNMKMWSQALLDVYDGRENEGIYICPMLAVCDPAAGFPVTSDARNIYSEQRITHLNNWVHPNECGYKQMGDALAAVLTKIKRDIKEI